MDLGTSPSIRFFFIFKAFPPLGVSKDILLKTGPREVKALGNTNNKSIFISVCNTLKFDIY